MNGVIIIDKEKEYTSFDVVAIVRKELKTKKVGHTGTLDPNATGVLVVLLGNATKAQDIIEDHDKEYIANFKFGIETDTLDIWGNVLSQNKSCVTKEEVENVLEKFRGKILQEPPMYSAVFHNGKRLYQLAREGKTVEREKREVEIFELSLISFDEENQSGTLKISCSKGTYIRSLIYDISKELNTIGVMTDLRRTKACSYKENEAIKIDEFRKLVSEGKIDSYIKSTESLFLSYPEVYVSDSQSMRFYNGNPLSLDRIKLSIKEDKKIYRVKDKENNFVSLGIIDLKTNNMLVYKHF